MQYPPRLRLANLPTPIHKLERISSEAGRNVFVWRDDCTGFVESGNKIRKLEFLLAHALEGGATRIITAGAVQSNHTRATSFAARRLGLKVALVVREPKAGRNPQERPSANLLLNRIAGADLHWINHADYIAKGSSSVPFLNEAAEHYRAKGEKPYVIKAGGSMPRGVWGYMAAVPEMLSTWAKLDLGSPCPDSLFFADGSGGTHAGLHLGFELNGLSPRQLWAINISDSATYFQEHVGKLVEETVQEFNLPSKDRELQVIDGYVGAGYAQASDDDLRFYLKVAREEGILLDPSYGGKAFRGMLAELRKNPDRFGKNILFLHTGGGFANFAFQERYAQILAAESA